MSGCVGENPQNWKIYPLNMTGTCLSNCFLYGLNGEEWKLAKLIPNKIHEQEHPAFLLHEAITTMKSKNHLHNAWHIKY